jgi:hypothetical protein
MTFSILLRLSEWPDFSLTYNHSSGCSIILSRYLPKMQIMTVGMAEAQQERQKKRDRLANSRSAR